MQVKLRIVSGKNAGREIGIRGASFVIGRGEGCDLRPVSETVSRRHCAVMTDADCAVVRDLGSSNGTFVNDMRIQGEHRFSPGDHLKVGPLHFEVLFTVPPQDSAPRVLATKATVEYVPSETKSNPDDYILDWLTDMPPSKDQVATVDLHLDEMQAQSLDRPIDRANIESHRTTDSTSQRKAHLAKLVRDASDKSLDVNDASDAAGVFIGEFVSAIEKNRR